MARPRKPPAPEPPKRRPPGSGSVLVRSDGRIAVYLPKGMDPARRPRYGPGQRERFASADQARAWLDAAVDRFRNPTARSATLAEPLGAYLARWHRIHTPGWPRRTARSYATLIRHFASIGDVRLGDLTHEVILGAISSMQTATWHYRKRDGSPSGPGRPFKASTIGRARAVLHIALEQLVPHVLAYNPVKRVKLPKVQESDPLVWDASQVDRFEATARTLRPDLYLAFRLILRRALRRGEVCSLLWNDVDERRGLIRVDETAGERAGETGDTKGRRTRDVPLGELVADVRAHRRRQQQAGQPSRWVLPGRGDDKPISMHQLNDVVHQLSDAAGLPRIAPKDMRATAATILLDEGVPLARVSRLLGHADVAVTARFYDRILANRAERVSRIGAELDAAFRRASQTAAEGSETVDAGGNETAKVSAKVSSGGATR